MALPDDRFYRHIIDSLRSGLIAIRDNGALTLMNDEAYRILALKRRSNDIGRPFADILRQRPEVAVALASAFDASPLSNRAEFRLKDIGRVVGYTISQVRDDDGRVVGVVMFFKDLTLVEQREEQERLRDRLASLGEMAAGIAHELKNPLAAIQVSVGLLRRKVADSPDTRSLLADIISEAKLANSIVVELLEFVRPIRLQVDRTCLAAVLQQAILLTSAKLAPNDVQLELQVPADLPHLDADPSQLCQVFTNLLTNAFEAMNGRGNVTISAAVASHGPSPQEADAGGPSSRMLVVDVADNGPGVPADLAERIFTPFFTTKPEGSGLGLSIVSKIVHAHDGRIDVSSTTGGTRFRITLPLEHASKDAIHRNW